MDLSADPHGEPQSSSANRVPKLIAAAVLAVVAVVAAMAIVNRDPQESAVTTATAATASTAPEGVMEDEAEAGSDVAPSEAEPVTTATAMTEVDDVTASSEAGEASAAATERIYDGPILDAAPPILGVEQELTNLDGWLQSEIDSLADLDGKVHIVQFWTFGCYNCKNTLANLSRIDGIYGGDNFEIVGVHAPEFEYEKDPDAILAAAEDLGVVWPIALDTNKTNFRSWQESRRFWPRTYVIDTEGNIRFDRIGEGAYEQLEATVAWLLEEQA